MPNGDTTPRPVMTIREVEPMVMRDPSYRQPGTPMAILGRGGPPSQDAVEIGRKQG